METNRDISSKESQLRPFGLYGSKDVLKKRLEQGYTQIAFGAGEWIVKEGYREKIAGIFAFYKPAGFIFRHPKIATFERPLVNEGHGYSRHGPSFEKKYDEKQFQEHVDKYKIKMGERVNLANIVREIEKIYSC